MDNVGHMCTPRKSSFGVCQLAGQPASRTPASQPGAQVARCAAACKWNAQTCLSGWLFGPRHAAATAPPAREHALAAASLSNAPLSVSGPRRHARAFAMAEGSKPRLKEAFALFDKDGDGYINHEELVTVMRSLGFNPTPAEVRDLISEGTSGQYTARGGRIDFELFCSLMNRKVKDDDTEAELKDAFRVLDKVGQGYVGVEEMRRICKQLGEDLTAEEVTDMISEAISNFEGKVYYDGFVKTLVTKS
jgi:calmodulin